MMKALVSLFVLLSVVGMACGCIQTPAKVAEETPGILKNISNDLSTMETPNVTLEGVLQPLKTSVDYIQPAAIVPTPIALPTVDPVVGSWRYVGSSGYDCSAVFTSDSKASASCSSWGIAFIQKSFTWTPERNTFTWMRNYTITDVSDNANYSVAYSEHTGRLTSEILPGNGYLVKVG